MKGLWEKIIKYKILEIITLAVVVVGLFYTICSYCEQTRKPKLKLKAGNIHLVNDYKWHRVPLIIWNEGNEPAPTVKITLDIIGKLQNTRKGSDTSWTLQNKLRYTKELHNILYDTYDAGSIEFLWQSDDSSEVKIKWKITHQDGTDIGTISNIYPIVVRKLPKPPEN